MEGSNSSSNSTSGNNGILVTNQRKPSQGIRLENPFTLKVGQVFTGFGFGCGIGIGVGRPINLGTPAFSHSAALTLLSLSQDLILFDNGLREAL